MLSVLLDLGGIAVKRFVAALMVVGGLLMACPTMATIMSTTISDTPTGTTITLQGTITTVAGGAVTSTFYGGFYFDGGYVDPVEYPTNNSFVSNVAGTLTINVTITGLTCGTNYGTAATAWGLINGSYDIHFVAPDVSTAPCDAPASIPSLSEWAQMLLALMVLAMIGLHFHRDRSY